jgi:hypothetical protein
VHRAYNAVKKAKRIQTPKEQVAAFRKAARELGAEATDEQFQGALRKIAKAKPSPRPESKGHNNRNQRDDQK